MKKVGLALGSGGWRGGVHIGVIKVLLKHNIPIDFIAGTSAGAIVGGLYAYKKDIEAVEKVFKEFNGLNFAQTFLDLGAKGGFVKGKNFIKYLNRYLNDANIEDTQIPFCAVASDILSGEKIEIKKGHLAKSVQASSIIPVLFEPTLHEGRYLVDGGLTSPVPVETVKNMGADIVIAVDTLGGLFPIQKKKREELDGTKMANLSIRLLLESLARKETRYADININPNIPGSESGFILKMVTEKHIIHHGEEATEKVIKDIKSLLK